MSFQSFGLHPSLARNLQTLKYSEATPVQAQAIPIALAGTDLVATAQTGTGKTAAFLLPVLHRLLAGPRGRTGALVLTPTRELAQQIEQVLRGLAAGTGLRGAVVIGGVAYGPQIGALKSGVDIVVATPGRLLDHFGRGAAAGFAQLQTLILDEADQMFDLGFLPALKRIVAQLPARRQTLLFSATMPPPVAALAKSLLQNPQTVAVGRQGTAAATVDQVAYPVPRERKAALLMHLLEGWELPSVLVFTRTKQGAKRLAKNLEESGHRAAELHANLSPNRRLRAMEAFRAKKVPILVATNVAARGLDVRHITHVVNFDVPAAPEEYVHRIGRTGRAGDTGDALVFVAPDEQPLLARIEREVGKRLERRRVEDFDYGATQPRRERKEKVPAGMVTARSVIAGGAYTPAAAYAAPKKKAYRGQGRRR